jgi:hypothetical protein
MKSAGLGRLEETEMKQTRASLAVALFLVVGVAQAVTVSESTGKGAYNDTVSQVPVTASVSFKAGVDANGVFYGSLQVAQNGTGKSADVSYHGNVTCYFLIDTNTAAFGGVITKSSDPSLVGQFFEVITVDNLTTPDQIGINITTRPPDCQNVKVRLNDLIRGSITVH